MQKRKLGGLEVGCIGLGCMTMTPFYGTPDPEQAVRTIQRAGELGVDMLDTSDAYGGGRSETLVGRAIAGRRDRFVIATKFGNLRLPDGTPATNGRPDYVPVACEASLKRLGVDVIDLYYLHRIDPAVPIEDSIGAMARLVEQGKVRHLGISEVRPVNIRRAHAVHPIAAVQTEYSLLTRFVEEEILGVCRELGIGFVAYSPLGRGLLAGRVQNPDELGDGDIRRIMPRFQGENLAHNLALRETLADLAKKEGCTANQLALAWVLSRGETIVPIVGTSRPERIEENAGAVRVTPSAATLAALETAFAPDAVAGLRTAPELLARLNL